MKLQKSMALLLLLVVLLGYSAIWRLQHTIDAQLNSLSQERDEVLIRSGKLAKLMSLEYAPLMAEVYWTRAVQYYGNKHLRGNANLELLWPLLDIATTLDPNLLPPYEFGAIFLSQVAPDGAGRPDLAVKLIQRGIEANPDNWSLYKDLAFVYYFDVKDYLRASEAFLEGSKKPGAFIWMKTMAAKVAAEGESYETSMFLWKEIYDSTKDPKIKENALWQLVSLKVKEDCRQIDFLADEYQKRFGRRPTRMSELIQAGLLRGIPVDPKGYAYVFGPDGKAALNLDSPLLEEELLSQRPK